MMTSTGYWIFWMKAKPWYVLLLLSVCWIASVQAQDSTAVTETTTLSPARIARRSAFLPGYGQWTNQQPWKVPIAAGGVALGAFSIYQTQQWKNEYREAAAIRLDADPTTTDAFVNELSTSNLLYRSSQRQQWNTHAIMFTLYSYGMNVLDAFTIANAQAKPVSHSPGKAAYYSALFPGLGQLYNRKWWKLPIVYGAIGTGVGFVVFNQQRYRDTQIAYITRTDSYPDNNYETAFTQQFTNDNLLQLQDFYRRNRDLSYIITAGLYLLNVVDAIVDGHLYSFDMSDDLSWTAHFRPFWQGDLQAGQYGGLSFSLTF